MSTNPVSSHAEASPARADLSRRILRGAPSVAALAVAAVVPAVAFAAEPDPIYAAIEEHRAAYVTWVDFLDDEAPRTEVEKGIYDAEYDRLLRLADGYNILEVEAATIASVAAVFRYVVEQEEQIKRMYPFAEEFPDALHEWAARSLERLAGGGNV